jgi:hypothetical protein
MTSWGTSPSSPSARRVCKHLSVYCLGVSLIEVDGQLFTDDELEAQALAADPDTPVADDAPPFRSPPNQFGDLLPDWYMPPPAGHGRRRRNAVIASVVIFSLLFINALGLCITYGRLEVLF